MDYSKRDDSFSTSKYWENRYAKDNNTGVGNYGQISEFKADILNEFVVKNNIGLVIEFGCGDGNQLTVARYLRYLGFDISKTALNICRKRFTGDNSKEFRLVDTYNGEKAELVLSLDVIYHLIEDSIFDTYMKTIFEASEKYVIVYSTNKAVEQRVKHIKHRRFTDWINTNIPELKLLQYIPNKYSAYMNNCSPDVPISDFYIFTK